MNFKVNTLNKYYECFMRGNWQSNGKVVKHFKKRTFLAFLTCTSFHYLLRKIVRIILLALFWRKVRVGEVSSGLKSILNLDSVFLYELSRGRKNTWMNLWHHKTSSDGHVRTMYLVPESLSFLRNCFVRNDSKLCCLNFVMLSILRKHTLLNSKDGLEKEKNIV